MGLPIEGKGRIVTGRKQRGEILNGETDGFARVIAGQREKISAFGKEAEGIDPFASVDDALKLARLNHDRKEEAALLYIWRKELGMTEAASKAFEEAPEKLEAIKELVPKVASLQSLLKETQEGEDPIIPREVVEHHTAMLKELESPSGDEHRFLRRELDLLRLEEGEPLKISAEAVVFLPKDQQEKAGPLVHGIREEIDGKFSGYRIPLDGDGQDDLFYPGKVGEVASMILDLPAGEVITAYTIHRRLEISEEKVRRTIAQIRKTIGKAGVTIIGRTSIGYFVEPLEHVDEDVPKDSIESEFGSLTGTDVATLAVAVKPHVPFIELLFRTQNGGQLLPEYDFLGRIKHDFGKKDPEAASDTDEQKYPISEVWGKALKMVRAEDFTEQFAEIVEEPDVTLLLESIRDLDKIPTRINDEEKTVADFVGEVLTNPAAMRKGVVIENREGNLTRVFETIDRGEIKPAVRNGEPFSLEGVVKPASKDHLNDKAKKLLEILGEYGGERVSSAAISYETGVNAHLQRQIWAELREGLTVDWEITSKRGNNGGVALTKRETKNVAVKPGPRPMPPHRQDRPSSSVEETPTIASRLVPDFNGKIAEITKTIDEEWPAGIDTISPREAKYRFGVGLGHREIIKAIELGYLPSEIEVLSPGGVGALLFMGKHHGTLSNLSEYPDYTQRRIRGAVGDEVERALKKRKEE